MPPASPLGAGPLRSAAMPRPVPPGAPAGTVTAQGHAIDQWWAGTDPAGQRVAQITAPTLIADGAADRLDPLANSHALAGLIPEAKLTLYPDAGHAFLFQDQAAFLPLIESFLGWPPAPRRWPADPVRHCHACLLSFPARGLRGHATAAGARPTSRSAAAAASAMPGMS